MRGGRARRMEMLKLWSLEEIRSMMGSETPIEGCLIVEVNLQLMQVVFTTEQPPAEWKSFEYEYDPRDTACIPFFTQNQFPVYGVFLGAVRGGIPLAVLSPVRGAKFGVASFRGGEHRFNILIHEAAHAAFRNRCVRLGDRVVVSFPYDQQKVARAKSLGGKFFGELKAWVFPAEKEAEVEEVLLK
jgi:hypothetical protein